MFATTVGRIIAYWQLMRFNRPIGILLLLWPTLWSLWLAAEGVPRWDILLIFIAGVVVMRAAGCVINDYADRHLDGHIQRTLLRPLITGAIKPTEALVLFIVLCLIAFSLVLMTNTLTIQLSFGAVVLAFCYPFMKRHTHLPQIVLGAAFAWGIPMAYAAQRGELSSDIWLVYTSVVIWTVVYDTFYAMVDRNDDIKVGIKSTAILFGDNDRVITAVLQVLTLINLLIVGNKFHLGQFYFLGLAIVAILFVYQQYLIRKRQREACLKAFLNNNWVGCAIFIGIAADFALS